MAYCLRACGHVLLVEPHFLCSSTQSSHPTNLLAMKAHNLNSLLLQRPLTLRPPVTSNWPRALLHQPGLKPLSSSIHRSTHNTKIRRQPNHITIRNPPLPQSPRKTTIPETWLLQRRVKSTIHLHPRIRSLTQHIINLVRVQLRYQLRAGCVLNTMIWPQSRFVSFVCVQRVGYCRVGFVGFGIGVVGCE